MRVVKRIIYAPSNTNRVPLGTVVVPKFPNIKEYDKQVTGDRSTYEEIRRCYERNIPMLAAVDDTAPKEIGYIIEHAGRLYATPLQYIKSLMDAHHVKATEASKSGITIGSCKNGIVISGNNSVLLTDDTLVYIYDADENNLVSTRVPICKQFIVTKPVGSQIIIPKGIAQIPSVKIVNQDILGVARGEVIDVSWNDRYRHE